MPYRKTGLLWFIVIIVVGLLSGKTLPTQAQTTGYVTSVIVSDIVAGAAVLDGTFTTNVNLSIINNETPELGVMGVELWLRFNPEVLGVVDEDADPSNGIQVAVAPDFFGNAIVIAANEVTACPSGGQCIHLAISQTGTPITNRNGRIAQITWTGQAAGDAGISVVAPHTIMADPDGNDIAITTTSVPAIQIVEPGRIQGSVQRQGSRTGQSNIAIVVFNAAGGIVNETLTGADGAFSLEVPAGGAYLVQASYTGYLKAQKTDIVVESGTVDIGATILLGGDVNNDDNINILDVVTIINRFGTSGWSTIEATDINDDTHVNIFDLTIATGNFGNVGPVTW
jgi:hypothetical protein